MIIRTYEFSEMLGETDNKKSFETLSNYAPRSKYFANKYSASAGFLLGGETELSVLMDLHLGLDIGIEEDDDVQSLFIHAMSQLG